MYLQRLEEKVEYHNLYSNDGRRLATCDWVDGEWLVDSRISSCPCKESFPTLEEAKEYMFMKFLEYEDL